jgi:hypothetical protein
MGVSKIGHSVPTTNAKIVASAPSGSLPMKKAACAIANARASS